MQNNIRNQVRSDHMLDYLVDEKVGIIHSIEPLRNELGAPTFYNYRAQLCNTNAFFRQKSISTTGGSSTNPDFALDLAIRRAIVAYCASFYEFERFKLGSCDDNYFNYVSPSSFSLYSDKQYEQPGFPWVAFNENTCARWVAAKELISGEMYFVPAVTVFYPYQYIQGTGEAPITQPSLTGLACESDFTDTIIAAIYDSITHDSLFLAWQLSIPLPHIRIETLSDQNYEIVSKFERTGSSITLLNATMDNGITTVLITLTSPASNAPSFICAGASNLNPELAIRQALEELPLIRLKFQKIKGLLTRLPYFPDLQNTVTETDHINFWCNSPDANFPQFLFKSTSRMDFEEMPNLATGLRENNLALLMEKITATGYQVLACDITTSDVRTLGLNVIRVVIPGYHTLVFGSDMQPHTTKRVMRISTALNGATNGHQPSNKIPHPFLIPGYSL